MAEPDEAVVAPPPMRRGYSEPDEYQRLERAENPTWRLVREGFWTGVGIALAFAAISAVLWLVVAVLFAAALA